MSSISMFPKGNMLCDIFHIGVGFLVARSDYDRYCEDLYEQAGSGYGTHAFFVFACTLVLMSYEGYSWESLFFIRMAFHYFSMRYFTIKTWMCVLLVFFVMQAEAQNNFTFTPPAKKGNYIRKTISSKKKSGRHEGRRKTPVRSAVVSDDSFWEEVTEKAKQLDEMTNYELEVEGGKGNSDAYYKLGSRLVFSDETTDLLIAMQCLEIGVEAGNVEALALLGYCHESLGQCHEALYYYRQAADKGNATGEYLLGLACQNGLCDLEASPKTAAGYFLSAARQDLASAQRALALLLYLGEGVDQDLESSQRWMRYAAMRGDEQAKAFLAENVFTKEGVSSYVRRCQQSGE